MLLNFLCETLKIQRFLLRKMLRNMVRALRFPKGCNRNLNFFDGG